MKKRGRILPVLLFAFFTISCGRFGEHATVREETQTIKTYPFSDPDPVPILAKTRNAAIYPYFRFDGFASEGRNQNWKVVCLENRYVAVYILPEAGGKIWGAVEKSTGKDFIYKNDVMKFRDIAMRGPWTSGGIEFNFGLIGHTPATATPVDYITRENADGSASCIVGAMDLPSRTQWRVEIRLPKDAAEFETISTWYNPTPFQHSYYNWANAAVHARDDLQFYYPGRYYIGHGGDVHPWPVNEAGIDLSFYRNHNFGGHKSLHVLGSTAEYSAGYWHDLGFGFGHWSRHEDMPGRKIWTWSLARSGAIWADLLTDKSGQYVEVQAGRQFSQATLSSGGDTPFTQSAFRPFATDTWSETWFPIGKIGGVVDANPAGALNVSRIGNRLRIGVNALRQLKETLIVLADGERLLTQRLDLQPMQVFEREVMIPARAKGVEVGVGGLLRWFSNRPGAGEYGRPVSSSPEKTSSTVERSFLAGRQHELMRDYDKAAEYYADCAARDRLHVRAMARLAEICCRKGEYEKSLSWAKRALQVDTYDAEANFIYGVAQQRLDNWNEAKEAMGWAARAPEFRSAAYGVMAEIDLAQEKMEEALEHAWKSLDANRGNISAMMAAAIAQRKLGQTDAAGRTLGDILELDPLNQFARAEKWLRRATEENRRQLASVIRSELQHESYLELAVYYAGLGMQQEAVLLLQLSPSHPVADYWLAYLTRVNRPRDSPGYLQKAVQASPRLVFPFRSETIPVLEWAASQERNWKTLYYLALLYWDKTRHDEAGRLLAECGNTPDYGPFYLTRAEFSRATGRPVPREDLTRALDLAAGEWRCWYALARYHSEQSQFAEAAAVAKKAFEKYPANHMIGLEYARALTNTGQYQAALDVMSKLNVLPYENASEGHVLYEKANLQLAAEHVRNRRYEQALACSVESRNWPEHLGAGKPYDPDERVQDYLESYCRRQLGKSEGKVMEAGALGKLMEQLKKTSPWKHDLLVSLR